MYLATIDCATSKPSLDERECLFLAPASSLMRFSRDQVVRDLSGFYGKLIRHPRLQSCQLLRTSSSTSGVIGAAARQHRRGDNDAESLHARHGYASAPHWQ